MCDIIHVYYHEEQNQFIDEDGYIIPNIHDLIPPNMIFLFKKKKDDMFIYGKHGELIEMIYEEPYDYLYDDADQIIDRLERSFI